MEIIDIFNVSCKVHIQENVLERKSACSGAGWV